MNALFKASVIGLSLVLFTSGALAQEQSSSPVDRAVSHEISRALIKAGIDPRTTSVQVITTADHVVYLTGLISNRDTIKLAGQVAAQTAPSYKIVNKINSSFFDDPNEVNGGMSK
jgi:osmotically-inducible protein OsmY